ncbi:3-oxoadipate enol-lactonase [Leifsonia kafniensis]|uniref:3-oxoadipate enol-lactonase n=1 Tax=Leifsonia kafniensis TaxID=475957 RepID=A0ABP7KY36_9MICO
MIERTEGFLSVADGEQIWCESAGTGPDLILSHGLGGNAAVWYQQLPFFAQNYRVITWDHRGFGRSTNTTGTHGPESSVSDLLAILDHFEVENAHLVGQSMGGWATLGTALAAPDRVASIVLACTTGGIPAGFGAQAGAPAASDPPTSRPRATPGPTAGSGPHAARPLGEHPALGERLPSLDPARAYLYQALGSFGARPDDSEFFRILTNHSFDPDDLRTLDIPTLLIAGELDTLMTPKLIRRAAEYLPNAAVIELAGRGHSPYFEDPDAWNTVVATFLTHATAQAAA